MTLQTLSIKKDQMLQKRDSQLISGVIFGISLITAND